jgi:hypothetical protein
MSQFRSKWLDLGCYVNTRIIRDHTKRKTFEQFEPQRYVTALDTCGLPELILMLVDATDKPFDI